ncbi:membrane-bound lytic murein transglycosylase B [Cricetibacter osteomyelitidis]|uniref:Membrane-bound lytic murein transglycosylase B n=1 Tax=Cricetibacter osteomyelitidis TaxID=1521931 RepID=A0A4R2SSQ5_9PAST|nr:lytic murein transglycosylase [Cricetibacter osteomyelitidis]TCP92215.1 membrane-bound lytic murein transglycosylase B [Cricetibacter osteomyelitidis]
MKFKNSLKLTALFTTLALAGCSGNINKLDESAKYTKARTINNFNDYVQFLKQKAAEQGVSVSTLNAQNNIRYISKAVDLDHKQAAKRRDPNLPPVVNPNGTTNYLNRVLTRAKVNKAETEYWNVLPQLTKASQKYGVQKEYLLALWGMESSFGYYQGNYDVLSVLATLAFDGRRESLFGKEFVNAMKMLDRNYIQRGKMLGSWAGAMGQTQFMPTSYLSYAADGDGDGEKDIWTNHYDVFASIATYLSTVGWDDELPWGVEVTLSQPMVLSLSGVEKGKQKSLKQWQAMGVNLKNSMAQELQKLTALSSADLWLVRPDKEAGRAFLVSNNFRTLLDWNRSNYFAVSIGIFADRIQQRIGL